MATLRAEPLEDRLTPTARLQVINDLPPITGIRPIADVFVDGVKIADDLAAGAGTPFVTVPSGVQIKIDVVNNVGDDLSAPYGTLKVTFAENTPHVAVAARYSAGLDLTAFAEEVAAPGANTDVLIFNGVEGLQRADVRIHGLGTVANNLAFGSSTKGYVSLPPAAYTVDVFRADGASRVATLSLDLSKETGGRAAVLTFGGSLNLFSFRSPGFLVANAVFADGSSPGIPSSESRAQPTFAVGVGGKAGLLDPVGTVIESRSVGGSAGTSVIAADTDGDAIAELVVTDPAGVRSTIHIAESPERTVNPFEESFTGGVFLAAGDFSGDGFDDIVVTPNEGGAGRVRVFNGKTLESMADFFGIEDPNFRGGARPAVGDVNGDGTPDVIIAAGFGGGPRIAVFDGLDLAPGRLPRKLMGDFFSFENQLRNGAFVAAADVNGDGNADLIFGGGPGGGPRVRVESGLTLLTSGLSSLDAISPGSPSAASLGIELANFFAGETNGRTGARVAAHFVTEDRFADLLVGLGDGVDPQVRIFLGSPFAIEGTPVVHADYNPFPDADGSVFVG